MKMLLMTTLLWPIATGATSLKPMTVKEFVTTFRPPTVEAGQHMTTPDLMDYWRAQGYLDGIKEATLGRLWCREPRTASLELDLEVWNTLKRLPEKQQQKLAGPVILNQLTRRHPCLRESIP